MESASEVYRRCHFADPQNVVGLLGLASALLQVQDSDGAEV